MKKTSKTKRNKNFVYLNEVFTPLPCFAALRLDLISTRKYTKLGEITEETLIRGIIGLGFMIYFGIPMGKKSIILIGFNKYRGV